MVLGSACDGDSTQPGDGGDGETIAVRVAALTAGLPALPAPAAAISIPPPVPPPPDLPPPVGLCTNGTAAVFHVASAGGGAGTPDGSPAHPFRTIREAFDAAAVQRLCEVVVRIRAGIYDERAGGPLVVTRRTRVVGEARRRTLVLATFAIGPGNTFLLESLGLFMSNAPGAVIGDRPALLAINDVVITSWLGTGVRQSGGLLLITSSTIESSRASTDKSAVGAGVGVLIDGGAQGLIGRVDIRRCSQGLVVADGSRVAAAHLTVSDTSTGIPVDDSHCQPDPTLPVKASCIPHWRRFSAVEVRDGASLGASSLTVLRAAGAGAGATGGGALSASGVRVGEIGPYLGATEYFSGGFGLVANGGRVRVSSFDVGPATLCGVVVGLGGDMDLRSGVVHDVPVGACVGVPGYDTERLHHDVTFVDVLAPLQAVGYSLPDPP